MFTSSKSQIIATVATNKGAIPVALIRIHGYLFPFFKKHFRSVDIYNFQTQTQTQVQTRHMPFYRQKQQKRSNISWGGFQVVIPRDRLPERYRGIGYYLPREIAIPHHIFIVTYISAKSITLLTLLVLKTRLQSFSPCLLTHLNKCAILSPSDVHEYFHSKLTEQKIVMFYGRLSGD